MISAQRILLTGFPGWLTSALLHDWANATPGWLGNVSALVHPELYRDEERAKKGYPFLRRLIPYDLSQPAPIAEELAGIDVVLHSAAVIHVRRTKEWYQTNTKGTLALARAAVEAGVRRFVFISSNAAGGRSDSQRRLLTEADQPAPMSHYGRSKWFAEQQLMQLHKPGRFEVVILRPSMFYGPPVPERHIDVYRRILHGRMPMVGDGSFARSITYIDNLVQATKLAMTQPAAAGETYYIVDSEPYTTRQISEAMAIALGVTPRFLRLPRLLAPMAFALDRALALGGIYWQNLHLLGEADWHVGISCQKAIQQLGYRPAIGLDEGMRRAVEWCRQQRKL